MPLTREIHGLVITDHDFAIPLDHSLTGGETIGVFAREIAAEDGRERPFLVFLQGGPGGLPPIARPTDDVYRATYERVRERNRRFYARYPDDLDRVRALHARLESEELLLPSGDRLTPRRFRQLGAMLGMSDGAERLHYL